MKLGYATLGVSVAIILLATLMPVDARPNPHAAVCIFCGSRGLADALLNVVLFLPLGIGLGLVDRSPRHALVIGLVLSSLIEGAQIIIPGRDPTLGDVLFNASGCTLGVLLVVTRHLWLVPRSWFSMTLSVGSVLFAIVTFMITGWLLAPSFPPSVYFGQWTPFHRHLQYYRGTVLAASIGGTPLPSRRLRDSDGIRSSLERGTPLTLEAIAGPPVTDLASIFSIADDQQREILLVGADRDDLIFRYRTRSLDFRLDQPELRLTDGLAHVAEGDTLRISVRGSADGHCVTVNEIDRCGLGFDVGAGWSVLSAIRKLPTGVRRILSAAWIGALLFPFGFWARSRIAAVAGGTIIAAGLAFVPSVTGLLPTPPLEWLGAFLAASTGWAVHRQIRRRSRAGQASRVEGKKRSEGSVPDPLLEGGRLDR